MAVSMIKNESVKFKAFRFENLTQYSPTSYYLQITDIRAKAGLPANCKILNASLNGWGGLGTSPNVELVSDNSLYVFFQSGQAITETAYVTIRFCYI